MIHPLERWPRIRRRAAFLALFVVLVLVEVPLGMVNGTLTSDDVPRGIFSMQIAGSAERAEEIRSSWEREGALDEAGFSLGLDFLVMPIYSTAIAALCAAVAFDVVETGLTVPMLDRPTDTLASIVTLAATVKFALLGLALAYVMLFGIVAAARRADAVE